MKPFSGSKQSTILASMVFILLTGCGWWHSLPADWDKDIPGSYQGSYSNYLETLTFETNGHYHHTILQAGKTLVDERGKWFVESGRFSIQLEPNGHISLLYDPMKRVYSTNMVICHWISYHPLPDGKTFFKISHSVNYEYCLTRQSKKDASPH